jgi:hypothetical protein
MAASSDGSLRGVASGASAGVAGSQLGNALAPHTGHLRFEHAGRGAYQLTHLVTRETVTVMLGSPGWELAFSPEGYGFMWCGQSSHWVQGRLSSGVFRSSAGRLFVKHMAGDPPMEQSKWLGDFCELRKHVGYSFNVAGGRPLVLDCYAAKALWKGVRVWWCMASFHGQFDPDERGLAGRWYHDRYSRWAGMLQTKHGLDPTWHLRKASSSDSNDLAEALGGDGPRIRIFDSNTMSTHALIIFWLRWSSLSKDAGGIAKAACVKKILGCLKSVMAEPSLRSFECTVFLDDMVSWSPPSPPQGNNPVTLCVAEGIVDVACISAAMEQLPQRHPMRRGWQVVQGSPQRRWGFIALLQHLLRSKPLLMIFNQLAWALASMLDEHVAGVSWGELAFCPALARVDVPVFEPPAKKIKTEPAASPRCDKVGQDRLLHKYWLAGRQHFDNCPVISFAVDLGRVGGTGTALGALAEPGGVAHWAPPQDRTSPMGPHRPQHLSSVLDLHALGTMGGICLASQCDISSALWPCEKLRCWCAGDSGGRRTLNNFGLFTEELFFLH